MEYQPPPQGFRTFLIVWATQSVSVFGSALTLFALNIWLAQELYPEPHQKPQLAFALSAINLAFALPTVFGAPLAGAWADRHDRKRTMMAMDAANGVLALALAILVLTGRLQLWLLVPMVALSAFLGAFHASAFDTSYAMLVPKEQLPRANGMMQTIWSLAGILAPGLAATLIALPALGRQGMIAGNVGAALGRVESGAALAMGIDALTFFAAAAALIFLFIPSPQRSELQPGSEATKPSVWADIREGGTFIWRRKPLLWLLGTFAVANFVGAPLGVFQPLLVKFNLAEDWGARQLTFETALALLASVGAIGGLVGGLLISAWGGLQRQRVLGVLIPLIVSGVALVVFGLSRWLYVAAAAAFIVEAMIPFMNAHSQSIWQSQTPHELQGRVFSVRRVIAQFSWPLSTALAGLAAGILDPGVVMAVLGSILTIFCIAQLFNPSLMQVEVMAPVEATAAGAVSD